MAGLAGWPGAGAFHVVTTPGFDGVVGSAEEFDVADTGGAHHGVVAGMVGLATERASVPVSADGYPADPSERNRSETV